jgi:hypothetical protein
MEAGTGCGELRSWFRCGRATEIVAFCLQGFLLAPEHGVRFDPLSAGTELSSRMSLMGANS